MSSRRLPLPRHRLHQHAHKGALRPRDPEHEAENRRAYQRRLDESAAGKMREEASTWCPKWPEPEKKNGSKPGGKFSGLSLD
jgi:hypothetical protein